MDLSTPIKSGDAALSASTHDVMDSLELSAKITFFEERSVFGNKDISFTSA